MKKSYLNKEIVIVLAGFCFLLAALLTESVLDGLLWGFAGGALGPGIGMIICISEVVFSILGKMGVITDHKIFVMYLFGLFVFQIVIGYAAYHQLRKRY